MRVLKCSNFLIDPAEFWSIHFFLFRFRPVLECPLQGSFHSHRAGRNGPKKIPASYCTYTLCAQLHATTRLLVDRWHSRLIFYFRSITLRSIASNYTVYRVSLNVLWHRTRSSAPLRMPPLLSRLYIRINYYSSLMRIANSDTFFVFFFSRWKFSIIFIEYTFLYRFLLL